MTVFLSFAFLAAILTSIAVTSAEVQKTVGEKILPDSTWAMYRHFHSSEHDGNCRESTTDQYNTNGLQRDAPHVEQDFSSQKLQHLEHVMENYTQWLQK